MEQEQRNSFLLSADFNLFNFSQLKAEYNNDKGIIWKNYKMYNGKPRLANNIKEDDIVYIYYKNLPDGIDRILLKGKVIKKCGYPKEKMTDYPGIKIQLLAILNNKNIGKKEDLKQIRLY